MDAWSLKGELLLALRRDRKGALEAYRQAVAVQPKLLLVGYLPYAWIGPVCVAAAIAGHVVLTRKLLQAPRAR